MSFVDGSDNSRGQSAGCFAFAILAAMISIICAALAFLAGCSVFDGESCGGNPALNFLIFPGIQLLLLAVGVAFAKSMK